MISFVLFLWTLYYQNRQKKIEKENYVKKIENISSQLDDSIFSQMDDIDEKNMPETWDVSTWNNEELMEKMIANQIADIDLLAKDDWKFSYEKRYKKLYLIEMKKNNIVLAIKAIKRLLKYTKHKKIWYDKIVDLYIQIWDFKNAEYYLKQLLKLEWTKENLKRYLYVSFQNLNFFNNKQIEAERKLLVDLYKKNVISVGDLSFYNFLLDLLTSWDIKNISWQINDINAILKDEEKKQLLISIKTDLDTYKQSKWSPLYYFKSLVALDLLKFGYFWLAKNIAEKVYIEDESYVLPKQILAYAYFYMWNYKNSLKYFLELKIDDKENIQDYSFFIWVSNYWLNKYADALLFLSQVNSTYTYYPDVLRYKLLSYIKIKDKSNTIETISQLQKYKLNYVDYYNIFKYLLFTCKDCYKKNEKLLIELTKWCYENVKKENIYVCWYAKANIYAKYNRKVKAVKYFKYLTKYFQDTYIYKYIWDFYYEKWDFKKAKYYYLKQLLYTNKKSEREKIKEKIKKIILNNNKK